VLRSTSASAARLAPGRPPSAGPSFDTCLSVTLRVAAGSAALVTVVPEDLDELTVALPNVASNIEAGWDDVLAKLSALVVRAASAIGSAYA
jgi:hypothetical protein